MHELKDDIESELIGNVSKTDEINLLPWFKTVIGRQNLDWELEKQTQLRKITWSVNRAAN